MIIRPALIFSFLLLVLRVPLAAADDDSVFSLGDSGPPGSTVRTYKRNQFDPVELRRKAEPTSAETSTIETYRRRPLNPYELRRRATQPSEKKSTLKTYSRSTFQEQVMSGERKIPSHPQSSTLQSYRRGERGSEIEAVKARSRDREDRISGVRDAMENMGYGQLAERLDYVIEKDRAYYDSKLDRLGYRRRQETSGASDRSPDYTADDGVEPSPGDPIEPTVSVPAVGVISSDSNESASE